MQYNKIAGGFASFPPPMIQGLSSAQQPQMVAPVAPGGAAPANALGGLAPGQSMPQPQTAAQQMPAQTMGVGGFGEPFGAAPAAPAPRLSGGDAWPPASPADMARYQQMFQRHDTDGDGKLSGGEIVPLLMALDPPKALLKDIWALADADADGALNQSEFCVAVYLTERAKEGRKPPATLPPGPFPPVAQAAPPAPAPAPAPAAPAAPASSALPTRPFAVGSAMIIFSNPVQQVPQ
jgi:epidermal growth factor receptor substrate 15